MTKRRSPLTFERALTKVAGLIGWTEAAQIVGQCERTVRNWSDEDTSAGIRLDAALKLDVAYRAAGGDGAPMLQVYQVRLETDLADASADRAALTMRVATAARVEGEAIQATIVAAQPGASDAQLARAESHLEDAIAADQNTLAAVRSLRKGEAAVEAHGS